MRYKELLYQGVKYTEKYKIDEILVKLKFHWLLDAEIENARLEIVKDTLVWNSGIWYNGTWMYGVFRMGEWRFGVWENGVWYNGQWHNGVFKSGYIYNGTFHKGKFMGGEVKKTMPKSGYETTHTFIDCDFYEKFKGVDMTKNEEKFYKQLDYLISSLNESNMINEGNIFDSIKNKIKYFIQSNIETIVEKLPSLIDYILNAPLLKNKKLGLLTYIATLLVALGVSVNTVKAEYSNKNIANSIEWSSISDSTKVIPANEIPKIHYALGEYKFNDSYIEDYFNAIVKNIPSGCNTIIGEMDITVSNDPDNPSKKNFAVDDTQEEKLKGGRLLEKRVNYINQYFIPKLKKMFSNIGIELVINTYGIGHDDRIAYINELKCILSDDKIVNPNNVDAVSPDRDDRDNNTIKTSPTGGFKDISKLSRNYQYVELLQLGGIHAKRFNGDKVIHGDAYSAWIVDIRKHVKEFVSRIKKMYPEYNIEFNRFAKAITPIKGSVAGMSNIDRQFTYVEESHIKMFESFVNEYLNEYSETHKKWKYILGSKFPFLTEKQAELFDSNIVNFLNFLEQMYGNSTLEFSYKK